MLKGSCVSLCLLAGGCCYTDAESGRSCPCLRRFQNDTRGSCSVSSPRKLLPHHRPRRVSRMHTSRSILSCALPSRTPTASCALWLAVHMVYNPLSDFRNRQVFCLVDQFAQRQNSCCTPCNPCILQLVFPLGLTSCFLDL